MHCFEFFQYCTQGIGEENQVPYAACYVYQIGNNKRENKII